MGSRYSMEKTHRINEKKGNERTKTSLNKLNKRQECALYSRDIFKIRNQSLCFKVMALLSCQKLKYPSYL